MICHWDGQWSLLFNSTFTDLPIPWHKNGIYTAALLQFHCYTAYPFKTPQIIYIYLPYLWLFTCYLPFKQLSGQHWIWHFCMFQIAVHRTCLKRKMEYVIEWIIKEWWTVVPYKYLPFFFDSFCLKAVTKKMANSLSRHFCWRVNLAPVFHCHQKGSPAFPLAVYSYTFPWFSSESVGMAHTMHLHQCRNNKVRPSGMCGDKNGVFFLQLPYLAAARSFLH